MLDQQQEDLTLMSGGFFFSPDDRSKVMDSKFKPRRIGMILVEDISKEEASSITNADVTVERSLS